MNNGIKLQYEHKNGVIDVTAGLLKDFLCYFEVS